MEQWLRDALAEEMLTPFLYYGVTEMRKKDGELIDEKENFSSLVTSERVDHILEKISFYEAIPVERLKQDIKGVGRVL